MSDSNTDKAFVRRSAKPRAGSLDEVRVGLAERLRSRRSEIERAFFAHARSVSDLAGSEDAEYVVGLRAALTAALDYVLVGIEQGADRSDPIPSLVVTQVHRAARNGVDLQAVLLGCAVGQRVLAGFVVTEADGLPTRALAQVLDLQGLLVERLMAEVSIEHNRELELERARRSPDQRQAQLVQRLLAGELLDTAELGYDLDAWHLGVIATGVGARDALRGIAAGAARQLLSVSHGEQTEWAWLGGRRSLAVADLERVPPAKEGVSLVIGEPGRGIDGWRLTHRQAQAALLVALNRPRRLTRYAEEMLLAAALRDETLARSLTEIYLSPLAGQRDGGAVLRATLRAYFIAGRNATETGVSLGIVRQTVEQRLRTVDHVLGRALGTCLIELEVALRLDELDE